MSGQAARSFTDMASASTRRLFLLLAVVLGAQVAGPAFAQDDGGG
jgi:hypothetical protein